MSKHLGKVAYGLLFVVFIPIGLIALTFRLDEFDLINWPVPFQPFIGVCLAAAGIGLTGWSLALLTFLGNGLPMNAYPTKRWVLTGPYRWFPHPAYVGFTITVLGIAIANSSTVGFWLISPLVAIFCATLVFGYEARATVKRLGKREAPPAFSLPDKNNDTPSFGERLTSGLLSLGVWSTLYSIFSVVPTSANRMELRMAWEFELPIIAGSAWIYSFAYIPVMLIPLLLNRNTELRRFVVSTWLACLIGFGIMILIPGKAQFLSDPNDSWSGSLLAANRLLDAEWLALPSFHAYWAVIFTSVYSMRWPHLRSLWIVLAVLISISCITTGQHAIVDVVAGATLAIGCWNYRVIWWKLLTANEYLANSWACHQFGRVRVIYSGLVAGLAAFCGVLLASFLAGADNAALVGIICLTGLVGAGTWGFIIEGGEKLARPFGYYGFVLGTCFAILALAAGGLHDIGVLAAATVTGGAFGQAIGRTRCMIQGCCHGRPVEHGPGICVHNEKSRIVANENLSHQPLYPTQLFSLIINILITFLLLHMWWNMWTWTVLVGAYFILSSLSRFVEENYRGESQTPVVKGLNLYQWASLGGLALGLGLACIESQPLQMMVSFESSAFFTAIIAGLFVFVAMGIDFPNYNGPLSRLSPK